MEFTIQIPAGKDCFHKSGKLCYFHEWVENPVNNRKAFCNIFGEFMHNEKCMDCLKKEKVNIVYVEG